MIRQPDVLSTRHDLLGCLCQQRTIQCFSASPHNKLARDVVIPIVTCVVCMSTIISLFLIYISVYHEAKLAINVEWVWAGMAGLGGKYISLESRKKEIGYH